MLHKLNELPFITFMSFHVYMTYTYTNIYTKTLTTTLVVEVDLGTAHNKISHGLLYKVVHGQVE